MLLVAATVRVARAAGARGARRSSRLPSLAAVRTMSAAAAATFDLGKLPERAQACARDLATARAVVFDVDSTVIAEEGIDVLAAHLGVGDQVAALTASAMGGDVPFEKALAERLAIMKPSKKDVEACLEQHPPAKVLNPGLEELMAVLRGGEKVSHTCRREKQLTG